MRFKAFKAPIGVGAMHREYEILSYLNGTPNKDDTLNKMINDESYYTSLQDLIGMGLIEEDWDTHKRYKLTVPGCEIFRLCHFDA